MATLPFLSKKDSRVFLPVLLITLFSFNIIYSQTVIREKVKINPTLKYLPKVQTEYSPLIFGFGGPRPFSFTITGPSGTFSG